MAPPNFPNGMTLHSIGYAALKYPSLPPELPIPIDYQIGALQRVGSSSQNQMIAQIASQYLTALLEYLSSDCPHLQDESSPQAYLPGAAQLPHRQPRRVRPGCKTPDSLPLRCREAAETGFRAENEGLRSHHLPSRMDLPTQPLRRGFRDPSPVRVHYPPLPQLHREPASAHGRIDPKTAGVEEEVQG